MARITQWCKVEGSFVSTACEASQVESLTWHVSAVTPTCSLEGKKGGRRCSVHLDRCVGMEMVLLVPLEIESAHTKCRSSGVTDLTVPANVQDSKRRGKYFYIQNAAVHTSG